MAKINIDVNSKYSAPETFTKLKSLFGPGSDIQKFDPKMEATFDDTGMSAVAKGGKVTADMKVSAQGPSSAVSITVEVPMLLGAFKGQIKSTIEKKLASLLG
jgi:hypothetical protein